MVAIKGAAIGRKPEAGPQWGETLGDGTCYTLNCTEVHAVAAQCHGSNVGPMGTLRAGNGSMTSSGIPFVAHALRAEGADASEDGSGRGTPLVAQATGFALNQRREGRLQDVAGAVHEPSGTQVNGVLDPLTYVHPRILRNSLSSNQVGIKDDGLSDALTSEGPGAVMQAIPRRLTPVECSRLQGFPDDWNIWGVGEDGARVELSDSARYRQLGNAVSVPVAEWIGHRLRLAADAST